MATISETSVIGTVSAARGEAFARSADGSVRRLQVGDAVLEGEVIVTAPGAAVEIASSTGRTLPIDEGQTVTLDAEVSGAILEDTSVAAVTPLAPSEAATVIQALMPVAANGAFELDPLAAGSSGGAAFAHLLGVAGGDGAHGGIGAETFAWRLGEPDSLGAPAVDHITGWGRGDFDVVNLKDVLQLDDPATLPNYLHFSFDGTHTTLEVKADGAGFVSDSLAKPAGGGDQVIVFENVNLVGSLSNQAEVINALLSANQLIID